MRDAASAAGASLLALALAGAATSGLAAQPAGWRATAGLGAWSVADADDWWEVSARAERRWGDGSRLGLGTASWRRFGTWDHSLEVDGAWRAGDRVWLDGRVLVTPAAEVREELALRVGGSLSLPPFAVGIGYRVQEYAAGPNHSLVPHVEWYHGDLVVLARAWATRTLHDTFVGAALGRATLRVTDRLELWAGAAAGEEDFVVGSGAGREVRTLESRTLLLGGRVRMPGGWSVRWDLTGTASDPRLDRAGGAVQVGRAF